MLSLLKHAIFSPSREGFVDSSVESLPERYAKYYELTDKAHGLEHINRVRSSAARLAAKHAPEHAKLVDMAAALHDIGSGVDRERHEEVGAQLLRDDPELAKQLSPEDLQMLVDAVAQHRASTGNPQSVVGKILSDADRMAVDTPQEALDRMVKFRQKYAPDYSEEESLRDSLRHAKEKFSPGAYGRRHYFPETDAHLHKVWGPILEAEKSPDPSQHLQSLLRGNIQKQGEEVDRLSPLLAVLGGVGLGGLGTYLGGRTLLRTLEKTPRVTEKQVGRIYDSFKLPKQLQIVKVPGLRNAFYFHPLSKFDIKTDPTVRKLIKEQKLDTKRLRSHGLIAYDPEFAKSGIIGHEAGHAGIRLLKKWYDPSRINQSVLTRLGGVLSMGAPVAGAMAGLHGGSQTPWLGPAVGGGAGLLAGLPTLINEYQASQAARDWMAADPYMRPETLAQNEKALRKAWRTYLYSSVLPGLGAGGLGTLLSQR